EPLLSHSFGSRPCFKPSPRRSQRSFAREWRLQNQHGAEGSLRFTKHDKVGQIPAALLIRGRKLLLNDKPDNDDLDSRERVHLEWMFENQPEFVRQLDEEASSANTWTRRIG